MHNLNLYSYYDKSLADVNREYLESLKNKPKRVSRSKLNKKVALAAAITLATGLIIANYLGVFSEKVVEVVEAPPPVDTRTEEEKQGYVQIQIFEFADTPVETITEPATQNDNYTGKVIQTAKAENIAKPAVNNSKEAEKNTDKTKEIEKLGDRDKEIIKMRYGLMGSEEYTQKEVADMLGISQSYISRIEKKTIKKLQNLMKV